MRKHLVVLILATFASLDEGQASAQVALAEELPVESLIVMLSSRDAGIRREAADQLRYHGKNAAGAVPALTAALKDPDDSVSWHTAITLAHIDPIKAGADANVIKALEAALTAQTAAVLRWNVRWKAVLALGKLGSASAKAVPSLVKALDDPDPLVRRQVVIALGQIRQRDADAIRALMELLKEGEPLIRWLTASTLNSIGPQPDQVPELIHALGDEDEKVRLEVGRTLQKTGASALPHLLNALESQNAQIRREAAVVLCNMGPRASRAIPALLRLWFEDKEVQFRLTTHLHKIGKELVPDLSKALVHRAAETRRDATLILRAMGPEAEAAVDELINLVKDADAAVCTAAASALGAIGPRAKAGIPALVEAVRRDGTVRREAVEALGRIGKWSVHDVMSAVSDVDASFRQAMVVILGNIGKDAEEAIPSLIRCLKTDESTNVRVEAARALSSIANGLEAGDNRTLVIEALCGAMNDSQPSVSSTAAFVLEPFSREVDVVQALVKALRENQNPSVRIAATNVLGSAGQVPAAIPNLISALNDNHSDVREMAVRSLQRIGVPAVAPLVVALQQIQEKPIRMGAARCLGLICAVPGVVVPALQAILNNRSEDDEVRREAERALKIVMLIDRLPDPSPVIRKEAALSLSERLIVELRLSDRSVGALAARKVRPVVNELIVATKDNSAMVQVAAAIALGQIGPEARPAVPDLIRLLKQLNSPWPGRLDPVAGALAKIGKEAVNDLLVELQDSNPRVRENVAYILGESGPSAEPAIPALIGLALDDLTAVRSAATAALAKIGADSNLVIQLLITNLFDPASKVRAEAAQALGRLQTRSVAAVSALTTALGDSSAVVRTGIADALAKIGAPAIAAVPALIDVSLSDSNSTVRIAASLAITAINQN